MTMHRILWAGAVVICIALGFVIAQQVESHRGATRVAALREQHHQALERVRLEADARVDAMARSQGAIVLQAFAAGISPSVLADRRDAVEIAAVSMLHVVGIAGVHVLALDGGVIYSSDAKLATTGEGSYRGSWALQATELMTRPSTRPELIEIATPIASAGQPQAVAWLEYDVSAAKKAALENTSAESPTAIPVDSPDNP